MLNSALPWHAGLVVLAGTATLAGYAILNLNHRFPALLFTLIGIAALAREWRRSDPHPTG